MDCVGGAVSLPGLIPTRKNITQSAHPAAKKTESEKISNITDNAQNVASSKAAHMIYLLAARGWRRFIITLRRTTTRIVVRAVKSRCATNFITAHGVEPGRQERNNANQ